VVKDENIKSNLQTRNIMWLGLVIVIIVLINFISSFVFTRFDLTSDKRYTLSEATKELLGNLEDVIYVKVYLSGEFPPAFHGRRAAVRAERFLCHADRSPAAAGSGETADRARAGVPASQGPPARPAEGCRENHCGSALPLSFFRLPVITRRRTCSSAGISPCRPISLAWCCSCLRAASSSTMAATRRSTTRSS